MRQLHDALSPKPVEGKLGASLNIFDGEELLLDLVVSLRRNVDFISIVFQEKGHWGDQKADPHLKSFLYQLRLIGLIDEVYEWEPKFSALNEYSFHEMDVEKREIGLNLARANRCTHFIVLDNDEFYTDSQFKYMKRTMMKNGANWDYSVLRHLQYYKDTNFVKRNREEEYVMGVFAIKETTKFAHGVDSRFAIDPARKIQGDRIVEFSRSEVCMHHLSYVRKNVRTKLLASQARSGNVDKIEDIVQHYEKYAYPAKGLWAHGVEIPIKRIEPRVKLKYYENDAYEKFKEGTSIFDLISPDDLPHPIV